MRMPISRFAVAVAVVVVAASAVIAAGCGKKNETASGLQYVPSTALAYLAVDANFEGDGWTRMKDIAGAFPGGEDAVETMVANFFSDAAGGDFSWETDIKPWLGTELGIAVFEIDTMHKSADVLLWADVSDEKAFDAFVDDTFDGVKTTEVQGHNLSYKQSKNGRTYWTIDDGVLMIAKTKHVFHEAILTKEEDESIQEIEGFESTIGEVSDGALATIYLNGHQFEESVREGLEQSATSAGAQASEAIDEANVLGGLGGIALGVFAEDDGVVVRGIATTANDAAPADVFGGNSKLKAINSLPSQSLVAIGANDVGKMVKRSFDELVEADPSISSVVARIEAASGTDVESVSQLLGKDMAIAVIPNVAGAPGVGAVSTLENEAEAQATLDAIVKLVRLSGSAPVATVKVAGSQVAAQSITINGTTVVLVVSGGRLIAANNAATVATLLKEGETLGDSDAFKDTLKDAGAPSKVSTTTFVNVEAVKDVLGVLALLSGGTSSDAIDALGNVSGWTKVTDDGLEMELVIPVDTDE